MNLQIADPAMPSPGELVQSDNQHNNYQTSSSYPVSSSPRLIASGTPHHNRTPSLGELHQELENEQEFQVNRLLAQIRQLQEQVQRQQQQGQSAIVSDEASDRSVPMPIPSSSQQPAFHSSGSLPRSPVFPRSSFDMARADLRNRSRTPSRHASPRLRSTSISADSGEPWALGGRDESAFYQAESQMLIRENQMLRHRIRELGEFPMSAELVCTPRTCLLTCGMCRTPTLRTARHQCLADARAVPCFASAPLRIGVGRGGR